MLNGLYQLSDIAIFIILSSTAIVISIIAIFLVKLFIPIDFRYKDNSVIANTSSLINVLYGVLAGLTALYLINNNSYTSDAVQREASAVANIYRESNYLQGSQKAAIQVEIANYLNNVIHVEWPAMRLGQHINSDGNSIIDNISADIHISMQKNLGQTMFSLDLLNEVKALYDARQQRIQMSYAQLDPEIWVVVLLGTILTLCINYLFGMNFYLHVFTVSAAALMTSSMLFLLISLDRPFQGEFIIEPSAFQALLGQIQNKTHSLAQK